MMSGTSRRLALITVTFNSSPVLDDFLDALDAQAGRDWILIVVDNASRDDTRQRLNAWVGCKDLVFNSTNVGFAAATNQGIRRAREIGCEAIVMLNNDTTFTADFTSKLLEFYDRTGALLIAPVITHFGKPGHFWYSGGSLTHWRGGFQAFVDTKAHDRPSWPAQFAPGCALFVAMEVFDRVGMLDEQFFVYWEDVDFALRVASEGLEFTVIAEPEVAHKVSALTGATSPFSLMMYHRNQVLLMLKHFGSFVTYLHLPAILLKIALRLLVGKESWSGATIRFRALLRALLSPETPSLTHPPRITSE
ncbi:MAG: glycosyltransferase family 2 protein [Erythrobacter sp.]